MTFCLENVCFKHVIRCRCHPPLPAIKRWSSRLYQKRGNFFLVFPAQLRLTASVAVRQLHRCSTNGSASNERIRFVKVISGTTRRKTRRPFRIRPKTREAAKPDSLSFPKDGRHFFCFSTLERQKLQLTCPEIITTPGSPARSAGQSFQAKHTQLTRNVPSPPPSVIEGLMVMPAGNERKLSGTTATYTESLAARGRGAWNFQCICSQRNTLDYG